jgi:hypothetical protein
VRRPWEEMDTKKAKPMAIDTTTTMEILNVSETHGNIGANLNMAGVSV